MITIYFETPCCDPIPVLHRLNFDNLPNKGKTADSPYVSMYSMHPGPVHHAAKLPLVEVKQIPRTSSAAKSTLV